MTRLLVYGGIGSGACDYYRLGMYQSHLEGLGVLVIPWTPQVQYPATYRGDWWSAIRDGRATLDLTDIQAGDVIHFSRWRNTTAACTVCGADAGDPPGLAAHRQRSKHESLDVDPLARMLVAALLVNSSIRSRCGIVYDLDDDLFSQPPWVGHHAGLQRELEFVELLIRLADLTTVSTPILESVVRRYTNRSVVVRNAIDIGLYATDGRPPGGPLRLLFYGAPVRIRDYQLCRPAVDDIASQAGAQRIWLGASEREVGSIVDKAYPYVESGAPFASRLGHLRPDIGLAPIYNDPFGRAKSELHWLEYTAAGAATVASRCAPAGPYDVIRDGVDGCIADTDGDWHTTISRLAKSREFRADLVGAARERLSSEYAAGGRALEWAAAYVWAATHPGVGLSDATGL